ncbi:MAG TPA: pitrilysin family protein [Myxococcota bacterium]|nr:pitrilysin family protein [Myxococcota bacterium]
MAPRDASSSDVVLRTRLANGLTVILCPRAHLSQTYTSLFFGVGSRHETPRTNGISHMLEHMLFRGTASYADATALNAAAEGFGGFLEGATYRDHMIFATVSHPSSVGDSVRILGELAQTPRYRATEVERGILREEILETLDADGRVVDLDNISHAAVFGKHGLSLPIEGTLANLERFGRRDLELHRSRHLVGRNAVVAVAGPFNVDAVQREVERSFGGMPPGDATNDDAPPVVDAPEPALRYVRDTASQVDIRLSFRAPPVQDPEYPALIMLARVLADGLASRMHAELVDRKGLAYVLHAGLTTYTDCGLFEFDVAVAPDRAAETVSTILKFTESAGRLRYRPEELDRARRRYRYGMEFMRDSAVELASWHGRAALFGIEDAMQRLGGQIEAVNDDQIRAAARRIFQRPGMVLTAVGELARGEWARVKDAVDRFRR